MTREVKSEPTGPRHRGSKQSAGILLYRVSGTAIEVLLAHPGGPFWRRRDDGSWTIPKGEVEPGEDTLIAARREFAEETGYRPSGDGLALGSIRQPGGKIVHVWAIEGDWKPSQLISDSFSLEWPPRSGRMQSFPEIDRAAWFSLVEARRKLLKGQAQFIGRLELELATSRCAKSVDVGKAATKKMPGLRRAR
jgi:predicted NUDIX family NTP pyrophosphohydrolase